MIRDNRTEHDFAKHDFTGALLTHTKSQFKEAILHRRIGESILLLARLICSYAYNHIPNILWDFYLKNIHLRQASILRLLLDTSRTWSHLLSKNTSRDHLRNIHDVRQCWVPVILAFVQSKRAVSLTGIHTQRGVKIDKSVDAIELCRAPSRVWADNVFRRFNLHNNRYYDSFFVALNEIMFELQQSRAVEYNVWTTELHLLRWLHVLCLQLHPVVKKEFITQVHLTELATTTIFISFIEKNFHISSDIIQSCSIPPIYLLVAVIYGIEYMQRPVANRSIMFPTMLEAFLCEPLLHKTDKTTLQSLQIMTQWLLQANATDVITPAIQDERYLMFLQSQMHHAYQYLQDKFGTGESNREYAMFNDTQLCNLYNHNSV